MKNLKNDWLIWTIILVPFLFVAYFWKQFPEQIATHFGFDGKPDDYSSKVTGLIMCPSINILFYFLFIVLPKIDPRKKSYALFPEKYKIIRLAIHSFLSFILMITIFFSLGYKFNLNFMVLYGILVLFLILGNLMGNVRNNFFVGIRTPWTLSSEEVWTKTHRFTAKLWVFSTIAVMLILPFLPQPEIVFGIYIALITIVPIVYSYIIFKKSN
ncbi:MAG: SdpI family protein [Bacteroidetes bacterium]|nr:SdpI family protein [Bacteroidota bacterium]